MTKASSGVAESTKIRKLQAKPQGGEETVARCGATFLSGRLQMTPRARCGSTRLQSREGGAANWQLGLIFSLARQLARKQVWSLSKEANLIRRTRGTMLQLRKEGPAPFKESWKAAWRKRLDLRVRAARF